MVVYCSIIVYSVLFSQKNQSAQKAKINTMKMLAGSIAHELRTPLSAIMLDANALSRYLPYYEEAYAKAKDAGIPLTKIHPNELENIGGIPESLQTLSRNAHTMINMLLTNLNERTEERKVERCSITSCVEEALNAYPFSQQERELVHWSKTNDFDFIGHKELIKHVMFNLIKNALYAIASVSKGEIYITVEPEKISKGKKTNQLIFKDTGPGISAQSLPHIFDRFYTKTRHGTGIGLAFCQSVIKGFGGEIACTSKPGEHTTFTISLPISQAR
jgi:signal transduction histidine kinase